MPILPIAGVRNTGLLARMPYQRGSLTGKFHPGRPVAEGHRARLQADRLADDIAAAERFRELADARSGGMGELAMQYVLHEDRISTTIPGARSIDQIRTNIENARAKPITDGELAEIERIQSAS